MKDIYLACVDFGIDGLRIDAVRHVNVESWQDFGPAIAQRARDNGDPDSFSLKQVTAFGNGGVAAALQDFFAQDDLYIDADSNAYSLPAFLGIHDMGRIGRFLAGWRHGR